jgi:hypothetical protein
MVDDYSVFGPCGKRLEQFALVIKGTLHSGTAGWLRQARFWPGCGKNF